MLAADRPPVSVTAIGSGGGDQAGSDTQRGECWALLVFDLCVCLFVIVTGPSRLRVPVQLQRLAVRRRAGQGAVQLAKVLVRVEPGLVRVWL